MMTKEFSPPPRRRIEEEKVSALAYWATGIACLAFLVFIFWMAGMKF